MHVSTIPVRGVIRSIRRCVCVRVWVCMRMGARVSACMRAREYGTHSRTHTQVRHECPRRTAEVFRWMLEEQGAAQPTSLELPTNITV